MERAIEIDKKHFAPDHPNLAIRYCNLAMILHDMGDREGARRYIELAIDIARKHFGPEHPSMKTLMENRGDIMKGD